MTAFFAVAMMHHARVARNEGFNDGIKHGTDLTLFMLEREKIIKIDEKGEIKGVQPKNDVV